MSTTKPNGGPAFPPTSQSIFGSEAQTGMSLRDYFAGQAISGQMPNFIDAIGRNPSKLEGELIANAILAYRIADAMIKARDIQS